MMVKKYLLISGAVFLFVVTGSYMFAHITVANATLLQALIDYLDWFTVTIVGVIFLALPFLGCALACGRANRRARTRSVGTLFCVAMATLAYFYFDAFQAAEHAMMARRWTAASLSIGLLPFFVGVPLWAVVEILAVTASLIDRRPLDAPER